MAVAEIFLWYTRPFSKCCSGPSVSLMDNTSKPPLKPAIIGSQSNFSTSSSMPCPEHHPDDIRLVVTNQKYTVELSLCENLQGTCIPSTHIICNASPTL